MPDIATVTAPLIPVRDLTTYTGSYDDSVRILVTVDNLTTNMMPYSVLAHAFVATASVPAGVGVSGEEGQLAISTEAVYTYTNGAWGASPRYKSNWSDLTDTTRFLLVDRDSQGLSEAEKANGRTNLGITVASADTAGLAKAGAGLTAASDGTLSVNQATPTQAGSVFIDSTDEANQSRSAVSLTFLNSQLASLKEYVDGRQIPIASATQVGGISASNTVNISPEGIATVPDATTASLGVVYLSNGSRSDGRGVVTGAQAASIAEEVVSTLVVHASSTQAGIVRVGDGLDVTEYGLLSVKKATPRTTITSTDGAYGTVLPTSSITGDDDAASETMVPTVNAVRTYVRDQLSGEGDDITIFPSMLPVAGTTPATRGAVYGSSTVTVEADGRLSVHVASGNEQTLRPGLIKATSVPGQAGAGNHDTAITPAYLSSWKVNATADQSNFGFVKTVVAAADNTVEKKATVPTVNKVASMVAGVQSNVDTLQDYVNSLVGYSQDAALVPTMSTSQRGVAQLWSYGALSDDDLVDRIPLKVTDGFLYLDPEDITGIPSEGGGSSSSSSASYDNLKEVVAADKAYLSVKYDTALVFGNGAPYFTAPGDMITTNSAGFRRYDGVNISSARVAVGNVSFTGNDGNQSFAEVIIGNDAVTGRRDTEFPFIVRSSYRADAGASLGHTMQTVVTPDTIALTYGHLTSAPRIVSHVDNDGFSSVELMDIDGGNCYINTSTLSLSKNDGSYCVLTTSTLEIQGGGSSYTYMFPSNPEAFVQGNSNTVITAATVSPVGRMYFVPLDATEVKASSGDAYVRMKADGESLPSLKVYNPGGEVLTVYPNGIQAASAESASVYGDYVFGYDKNAIMSLADPASMYGNNVVTVAMLKVIGKKYFSGSGGSGTGGSGTSITVDQSYSPTSPNAQSGYAVAQALKTVSGGSLEGITLTDYKTIVGIDAASDEFYTTIIGTEAKSSDAYATVVGFSSEAVGAYATAVGFSSHADRYAVALGSGTVAHETSVVIGAQGRAYDGSVAIGKAASANFSSSIAIGHVAIAEAANSIQLGTGENRSTGTLQVYQYQLLDANGKIPAARLPDSISDLEGIELTSKKTLVGIGATASNSTVAVGHGANASSSYTTVLGQSAVAAGRHATALGCNAVSSSKYATAIGAGALAAGIDVTAVGQAAKATFDHSTALGRKAIASYFSTALGSGATAGAFSCVIGYGAKASSEAAYSLVAGGGASAKGYCTVALGHLTSAGSNYSIAVGQFAKATGERAISIGQAANASAANAIQFGYGTNTVASTLQVWDYPLLDAKGKIPVDRLPDSLSELEGIELTSKKTLVGIGATTLNSVQATTVGNGASAGGNYSVAIGSSSNASKLHATAVGSDATASGMLAVAIGRSAKATGSGAIQLGYGINAEDNTLQVRGYQLLDVNGKIPVERLPTGIGSGSGGAISSATGVVVDSATGSIVGGLDTSTLGCNVIAIGTSTHIYREIELTTEDDAGNVSTSIEIMGCHDTIALGTQATAMADGAIQIGRGTNSTAETLQVYDYVLLNKSGKVPTDRLYVNNYYDLASPNPISARGVKVAFAALVKENGGGGSGSGGSGSGSGSGSTPSSTCHVKLGPSKGAIACDDATALADGEYTSAYGDHASARAAGATALGASAAAIEAHATAVGYSAQAAKIHATAIGAMSNAAEDNATALGFNAVAAIAHATAVGAASSASAKSSVAIGAKATASGESSVAIGGHSTARETESLAFGIKAAASGKQASAIGYNSSAEEHAACLGAETLAGKEAVAVGRKSQATSRQAIAIGSSATAAAQHGVAIGFASNALAYKSIQIGEGSNADDETLQVRDYLLLDKDGKIPNERLDVDMAFNASSEKPQSGKAVSQAIRSGVGGVGIGNIELTSTKSVVGVGASAVDDFTVALGADAIASADGAVAIGMGALAASHSTAVGAYVNAAYVNTVAIGYRAAAQEGDAIAIGVGATADAGSICIGSSIQAEEYSAALGYLVSASSYAVAIGHRTTASYHGTVVGINSKAEATDTIAIGYKAEAVAEGAIQLGKGNNSSTNTLQVWDYTLLDATGKIPADRLPDGIGSGGSGGSIEGIEGIELTEEKTVVGIGASASGYNATAIGYHATAGGCHATALGCHATASNQATALGYGASASSHATALGYHATAGGYQATAIGKGAQANSDYATSLGSGAQANSDYATALGNWASANIASTALGKGASASGTHSTALGIGASTNSHDFATAIGCTALLDNSAAMRAGDGSALHFWIDSNDNVWLGTAALDGETKYKKINLTEALSSAWQDWT